MTSKSLQALNLRNLLKTGAFRFIDASTPWFYYTSGQVGPYYVQSISIEKDGTKYACAVKSLVALIKAEIGRFDVISGGETRDWDFSNPVAVSLKKPHAKMYKDGRLIGADVKGKTVLHVADLNNEGSSVRDYWRPIIAKNGGSLIAVVSFVDRMEEGVELFKKIGLPSFPVVPLDKPAWDLILTDGLISGGLHKQLIARMRDRRKWAVNALLANPEYFRRFYSADATRAKAEKIMRTYPEITERFRK
jgi:orotate phosphoribosyltransferase